MTENEALKAHLAAVEALAAGCLVFLLASSGNDPDLSKARAITDVLYKESEQGLDHLPADQRQFALSVLSDLLSRVLSNSAALRGIDSAPRQ